MVRDAGSLVCIIYDLYTPGQFYLRHPSLALPLHKDNNKQCWYKVLSIFTCLNAVVE
jgi:hypothetical protein